LVGRRMDLYVHEHAVITVYRPVVVVVRRLGYHNVDVVYRTYRTKRLILFVVVVEGGKGGRGTIVRDCELQESLEVTTTI
jgi:hypothetical protein